MHYSFLLVCSQTCLIRSLFIRTSLSTLRPLLCSHIATLDPCQLPNETTCQMKPCLYKSLDWSYLADLSLLHCARRLWYMFFSYILWEKLYFKQIYFRCVIMAISLFYHSILPLRLQHPHPVVMCSFISNRYWKSNIKSAFTA